MYKLETTKSFNKSFKKLSSSDKELALEVIDKLLKNQALESKYKDHKLKGNFKDFRECHIKPDLLLIYQIKDDILTLTCINIGNHNTLF